MIQTLERPSKLEKVRSLVHKFENFFILNPRGLQSYTPHVRIEFSRGDYTVKTAENAAELGEVLRLRYEVFHREYKGKKFPFGIDVDEYDAICDHLIIYSKKTNAIVGTYRLNCSKFNDKFYSQSEFSMNPLLDLPGVKLELGRACIHKDFRNGMVMTLLWRGLTAYLREVGAEYLFGCSSIRTMNRYEISLLYKYFRDEGVLEPSLNVVPTEKFRVKGLQKTLAFLEDSGVSMSHLTARRMIPSLLGSYIKAGAKIVGEPALDRDYKCIDFLTLLKVADLDKAYDRRFQVLETE